MINLDLKFAFTVNSVYGKHGNKYVMVALLEMNSGYEAVVAAK